MNTHKEEIKQFVTAVEKVTHIDSREPLKNLVDMGLCVFEHDAMISTEGIVSFLPEERILRYTLNNTNDSDDFINALNHANEQGYWFVVDCRADPSPTIIGVLKQISEMNEWTVRYGDELSRVRMHPDLRIVFFINNDILENIITFPFFLSFFGPVFRITS